MGDGGEKPEEKHRSSQEGNGDEEQVAGHGGLQGQKRYHSLDHLKKLPFRTLPQKGREPWISLDFPSASLLSLVGSMMKSMD